MDESNRNITEKIAINIIVEVGNKEKPVFTIVLGFIAAVILVIPELLKLLIE